jgi:Tfp pilus assembly protein PilN
VLRTNLATKPFYNERAVHVGLAVVAALVLILTIFNVSRAVTLSRENTLLQAQIGRDEAETARLKMEAEEIRRGIDDSELEQVVEAAREANALIDQRTFSWTEFFNRLEATLPADVMITQVKPQIRDGVVTVEMIALGRRPEDIAAFMDQLEATGAFTGVLPVNEHITEEGLHRITIRSGYENARPAFAGAGAPATVGKPSSIPGDAPATVGLPPEAAAAAKVGAPARQGR